jgi:hypothetical protein
MTAARRTLLGTTERPWRRVTATGANGGGRFFARLECGHRVVELREIKRLQIRCPRCKEVPKR